MYTQCPRCLAVYEPTPYLLARGRGRLECGACGHEFDALERLGSEPIFAAAPNVPAADKPPRVRPERAPEQGSLFAPLKPETPTFAAAPAQRARQAAAGGRWWGAAFALALLLGAQIVFAERAELARDPAFRPWLLRACDTLHCTLPAWRDPGALKLLARDVRPHPSVPDALLISATFRNDAPWPQAWPQLQIALADLDGRTLGLRRFAVEEYLGAAPRAATLAPGQSATATIELQDPGKQAVAFAFEFR
jgi:hypothetical protein